MLAGVDPAVVEVPQLGPLVARVPLPELVAEAEDPLLGARALSSSRRAAEAASKPCSAIASSSVTDWRRLREARARIGHPSGVDRVLHRADDQAPRRPTPASRKASTSGKL